MGIRGEKKHCIVVYIDRVSVSRDEGNMHVFQILEIDFLHVVAVEE